MKRQYPQGPIVGVVALIVVEGRMLLGLRRNPPNAGEWGLPGGAQELGETALEALHREVREETGLLVAEAQFLDVGDIIFRDAEGRVEYQYTLLYYLVRPGGGQPAAGDDVAEIRWVAPEEVWGLGLSSGLIRMVQRGVAAAQARDRLVNDQEP